MSNKQAAKINMSGLQVMKTLLVLLNDNYSMEDIVGHLNEKEKTPIFNSNVVSKYINTCRFCGIEIYKIQNKYFIGKLPFGLNFTLADLNLLARLQEIGIRRLTDKAFQNFNNAIMRLNKFSNKDIANVSAKTMELVYELFDKAVREKRRILLRFKAGSTIECIPNKISIYKEKECFNVFYKDKEKNISINRIAGMELLGKIYVSDNFQNEDVVFKLTGQLAQRYSLREHETLLQSELPNYIKVSNNGEDKDKLLSRLLRYDKYCEILTPKSYRDEMKLMIEKMLENYGE